MLGESLGSLPMKDLKSLETRIEKGISRIRSKKVSLLCLIFYVYKNNSFKMTMKNLIFIPRSGIATDNFSLFV